MMAPPPPAGNAGASRPAPPSLLLGTATRRRGVADPTVEEREVAGVPTSRLPPVKFDFLPNSGAHPPRISRECLCSSCVVQSKHCVEIITHRPSQPKENLVVKHLFPPGKQQYIPKHCPALCYVYTVILKHMMLHLQIHKLYLYSWNFEFGHDEMIG